MNLSSVSVFPMPRSNIALKHPADAAPATPPARTARPQVLPLKQPRALRTRQNLLKAGRTLLQDGGFEQMSIAQIAKLAGCSVGAFYFGFRDKEAFFRFLLDDLVAEVKLDSEQAMAPQRLQGLDRDRLARRCVEHFVDTVRRHEGLVRTVTQHTAHDNADWQPMHGLGLWMAERYAERLLPHFPAAERKRAQRNAVTGFMIVMGFVVNAVLHRPSPLHLHSPDLVDWLSHVLQACLDRPAASAR
jgi:AcrR family transcriptional regulator